MSMPCSSDKILQHRPVLPKEVLVALIRNPDGVYVDATFGRGGHTRLILGQLSAKAKLFAFDRDAEAVQEAQKIQDDRFHMIPSAFSRMREELQSRGVNNVDGILMDIGVSSPQIDDPKRGFSFRTDGPLDMRMDQTQGISAAQWLKTSDEKKIESVLREYGEERFAKAIARAIVREEEVNPIETTLQLARLVEKTVPRSSKDSSQHPATRTFQAIRIAVNDEFGELRTALEASGSLLRQDGRLVVISFHSLEDRIVKRFFAEGLHPESRIDARLALRTDEMPHPVWSEADRIRPSDEETNSNPRARSAILRAATRTGEPWSIGGTL